MRATMIGLSQSTLSALSAAGIQVPRYERQSMDAGVVHFGPGAFHRVHQAWFFDRVLADDPRWGLCEVALKSPGVRDALAPQDGLYTLATLDAVCEFRIVGAIKELLVASESKGHVLQRLLDPRTRLITATVTEKGYCLRGDGSLDRDHPDIRQDLAHPSKPQSLIGFLAAALRERRARKLAPPTIISCDNLTDNGRRLKRGVLDYCETFDVELAAWIDDCVAFPSTMVDSITPATDDALRDRIATEIGVRDRWPVQREAFTQWVIEDDVRGEQPDWHAMGVTITDDVKGFERAKLRLLNGAHSTLAYVGSLAGYETVAQAMADAGLAAFIDSLMRTEIAPTLHAPRGLDVPSYIESVLNRFRNPAIRHLLAQIAWDGSQKLPFRLLGTIEDALAQGHDIHRLALPIAAWMQFVRRKALRGERATDPLAEPLFAIGSATTGVATDVHAYLGLAQMFPRNLVQQTQFTQALESAYAHLNAVDSPAALRKILADVNRDSRFVI